MCELKKLSLNVKLTEFLFKKVRNVKYKTISDLGVYSSVRKIFLRKCLKFLCTFLKVYGNLMRILLLV